MVRVATQSALNYVECAVRRHRHYFGESLVPLFLNFGGNLIGLSVAWACIHQAKQFMTIRAVRAFPVPITPDGSLLVRRSNIRVGIVDCTE